MYLSKKDQFYRLIDLKLLLVSILLILNFFQFQ